MRKNKSIDTSALMLAILFTIVLDVVVALCYEIRPADIAKLGLFGLPMFLSMCALSAGVPLYWSIRFFRRWSNRKK